MPKLDRVGTFSTMPGARATIKQADSGAVALSFMFTTDKLYQGGQEYDYSGRHIFADVYYIGKNGELIDHGVNTLRDVLGWDGDQEHIESFKAPAVQIVVESKPYGGTNPKYQGTQIFEVKWINAIGGSGGRGPKAPDPELIKSLAARFGGQLRAAFGGPVAPTNKPAPRNAAPDDDTPF